MIHLRSGCTNGLTKKYFFPSSFTRLATGCHAILLISFRVCVAKCVSSAIPGTMNSRERCFSPDSLSTTRLMTMESSSRVSPVKSTPTSSSTSRTAHSISGSSLLILPLGNPQLEPLLYPLTMTHLSSLGFRTIKPPVGTLNLYAVNFL